jgi:hypothetical protein
MLHYPKGYTVEKYIMSIKPGSMDCKWDPPRKWHPVHGSNTSTGRGGHCKIWCIQSANFDYLVEIVQNNQGYVKRWTHKTPPDCDVIFADVKSWRNLRWQDIQTVL